VVAPADFAIQYDLSSLYSANPAINGAGQTIAVIDDSNINVNIVNQYRSLFGLSANPPQIIIDGNDPGIDGINNPDGPNGGSVEAYLDVELAGSVAPAATIDLVIGADTALVPGFILAAEHAVFGNIAPVISLSRGFCEAGLGSVNSFLNALWEEAAAQGITVVVSSGDSGSAGCDDFNTQEYAVEGLAVSGFASTPFNVAVGGTDFFYSHYNDSQALQNQIPTYWNTTATQLPQASLKQVIPEQPWNDSQYGLDAVSFFDVTGTTTIAAGSGGASACATGTPAPATPLQISGSCAGYPKPPWQTGAGVPAPNVRYLPDVSLFAADGTNYSFYPICAADGDCQSPTGNNLVQISGAGGTSASVQAFAGIMALVNQKYGRQGQANFVLYPLKAQFPAAFHDVLQGTNSVPCAFSPSSPNCISVNSPIMVTDPVLGTATEGQIGSGMTADYNAAAGYNLATGLGTIDAAVLVNDWGNVKFTATTVSLTSPTAGMNVAHGTSVNFAGTVSGDAVPTGNVAIETDGTVPLSKFVLEPTVLPLSGNGSFSGPISFLPGGTYNVWANYGGDATDAPSASPKVQITVNPEASTIYFNILNMATQFNNSPAIVSGAANVPYGTQLILSALPVPTTFYNQCIVPMSPPLSCQTATFTLATGTVAFSDNGSLINTAVVNAVGEAEFNGPWSVGAHSVTAAYSGDPSYNASNAGPISFTIAKNTPTIVLSSAAQVSPGTYQGGQATVFTIQVENSANLANENNFNTGFSSPAAAPTGNINVTGFPNTVPTSAPLSPAVDPVTFSPMGVATIIAPANTPTGTYGVTFTYSGDANYNPAMPLNTNVTIVGAAGLPTTTAITSFTGSISPTTNISVMGTVTGQNGQPAPTGSVLFFSSGFNLMQVPVSPGASDVSSFSAILNSQNLFQGRNLITVQYLGDKNYAPSSTTLSIIANPLSDFSIVPEATIVPIFAGSSKNDTINVSSVNGFSGMITFNCTPPTGIVCPSPSAINLAGGASTPVVLQINASAAIPSFTVGGSISAVAGSTVAAPAVTPNGSILLTATSGSFVHTLGIALTSPVQVSCPAATLPPGVTCLPNPANLNVNSSSLPTGQLTMNVLGPSASPTAEMLPATRTEYAGLQRGPRGRSGWWRLSAGAGLAAIVLFFLPGRRRYRTSFGLWLICVLSFAMGCGGGGSSGGVGPVGPGATTTKITASATKAASPALLNFTVDVTLVSSGAPAGNGTVQLVVDGKVLTTMAAVNGVAMFSNINSLSVGTHAISASYQGDANTQASQSGNVNVTITGTTQVPIQATSGSLPVVNGMINLTIM